MDTGGTRDAERLPVGRSRHRSTSYQPGLDGLRGLAVTGVLLFHGGFTALSGGFLGVSTFFTLSGFLITTLLLCEHAESGRIDLRRFWTRRFRRLRPAALLALLLAVLYVAMVGESYQYERLRLDIVAALADVENWRLIFGGNSYVALFSSPSPVQHFWSLAIEEQFYFAFPIAAAVLLTRGRAPLRWFTLGLVAAGVASCALLFVLYRPGDDPSRVYYGSDTRALELIIGALLAVIMHRGLRAQLARSARLRLAVVALGVVGLVGTTVAWLLAADTQPWLYRGGLAAYALGSCCVILAATVAGPVRSLLSVRPLRALGRISYGVYLFHWPVFLWLTPSRTGLGGIELFIVRCTVTIACAALSYHAVEQPIRRGERMTRRGSWVLAPTAALVLCGIVVAVSTDPPPPPIVFRAVRADSSAPPTAAPVSVSPTNASRPHSTWTVARANPGPAAPAVSRVMLVGDSVAQTLGRGFERWATPHGLVVWNVGRFYCGVLGSGDIQVMETQRSCDQLPTWRDQVAAFDPDVVIVLSTIWDVVPRQWAPGEDFLLPGVAPFDDRYVEGYSSAVDLLSAGGARVVVLDPMCVANPEHSRRLQYARDRLLPRVAQARPGVHLVDVTSRLCPGGAFDPDLGGVTGARPDGIHFDDQGADWVASWLMPMLLHS